MLNDEKMNITVTVIMRLQTASVKTGDGRETAILAHAKVTKSALKLTN